jgi:hypothetical protein
MKHSIDRFLKKIEALLATEDDTKALQLEREKLKSFAQDLPIKPYTHLLGNLSLIYYKSSLSAKSRTQSEKRIAHAIELLQEACSLGKRYAEDQVWRYSRLSQYLRALAKYKAGYYLPEEVEEDLERSEIPDEETKIVVDRGLKDILDEAERYAELAVKLKKKQIEKSAPLKAEQKRKFSQFETRELLIRALMNKGLCYVDKARCGCMGTITASQMAWKCFYEAAQELSRCLFFSTHLDYNQFTFNAVCKSPGYKRVSSRERRKILKLVPWVLRNLGWTYARLGNFRTGYWLHKIALDFYIELKNQAQTVQERGRYFLAWLNVQTQLAEIGQQGSIPLAIWRLEKAIASLTKATLGPTDFQLRRKKAHAFYRLASLKWHIREKQEALEYCEEALGLLEEDFSFPAESIRERCLRLKRRIQAGEKKALPLSTILSKLQGDIEMQKPLGIILNLLRLGRTFALDNEGSLDPLILKDLLHKSLSLLQIDQVMWFSKDKSLSFKVNEIMLSVRKATALSQLVGLGLEVAALIAQHLYPLYLPECLNELGRFQHQRGDASYIKIFEKAYMYAEEIGDWRGAVKALEELRISGYDQTKWASKFISQWDTIFDSVLVGQDKEEVLKQFFPPLREAISIILDSGKGRPKKFEAIERTKGPLLWEVSLLLRGPTANLREMILKEIETSWGMIQQPQKLRKHRIKVRQSICQKIPYWIGGRRMLQADELRQIALGIDSKKLAILNFFIGKQGNIYVCGLRNWRKERWLFEKLKLGPQELELRAKVCSTILASTVSNYKEQFQELYSLLITPLEDFLEEAELIYIVPDEGLLALPFHVFIDKNGHFMIEKWEVAFAPSASLLGLWLKEKTKGKGALLIGLDENIQAIQEIRLVNEFLREKENVQVPEGQWKKAIWKHHFWKIVHLCGHGCFNPEKRGMESWVEIQGERVYAEELLKKGPLAEFVFLHACSTGRVYEHLGELWGFPFAVLGNGSRSCLLAFNSVDSQTAPEFAEKFYKSLLSGADRSTAVANAMRAFIDKGNHPSSWASYLFWGDFRSIW